MHALPPELWREVLLHLSMPRLQLLKAVCRAMAQHCRAMLRSEAWQTHTPLNEFAMRESIKTQVHVYKLPLTVSIYPEFLPEDAQCIATIHHMKLMAKNWMREELVHSVDATTFEVDAFYDRNNCLLVRDLCIEVHGEGIFTSETALRQVLQRVLRARGKPSVLPDCLVDSLWNYTEDATKGTPWSYRCGQDGEAEPLKHILESINPVTQIRTGKWVINEAPWSMLQFERWNLDIRDMCRMGLGLFT